MKNKAGVVLSSLVVFTLVLNITACSIESKPKSAAEELAVATDNTVSEISTSGVVASGTYHGNQSFTEVHDPSSAGGRYVNDAVLTGPNLEFRQISRQSSGDLKAFKAAIGFAQAKIGDQVEYASSSFNVLGASVASNKTGFSKTFNLEDAYGNLGKFKATVAYTVENGLVTGVSFDQALFDKDNPEEVCIYSPTNCIIQEQFDFDPKAVSALMLSAFDKYEVSQNLASGSNKDHFEAIMRKMQKTASEYRSWTTTNVDKNSGSIFDAATGQGVSFNPYDETTRTSSKQAYSGRYGPDSGFVSSLFFDTTDGGSTYFYGPISFSAETSTFTIRDNQGNLVAKLHFIDNLLVDFVSNTIGLNEKFTISKTVDQDLLKRELAKLAKP